MAKDQSDRLRASLLEFMKLRDMSMRGWANQAGVSPSGLRDFLSGRNRTITDLTLSRLAAASNVDAAVLRGEASMPIPLHGYIGAGDVLHQFDGDERPPLDFIERPPGLSNGAAVIVRGDSMVPIYFDGDVLFYEQKELAPERALGRECIVQTAPQDGGMAQLLVKRLLKGSRRHRYHLVSVNPAVPAMEDRAVAWVAKIKWVKRA